MNMDETIRDVIKNKLIITCNYDGLPRKLETHVYGRKGDKRGILVYQIGGKSKSGHPIGWKRMYFSNIDSLVITTDKFKGKRDTTGTHQDWDEIYLIVED